MRVKDVFLQNFSLTYTWGVGGCQSPKDASPVATPVQLSLPYSAVASAPSDATLVATLMQPNMPHSAAVHASELPRQALDQTRQVN